MLKCEVCEFESDSLDEVAYYDILGSCYCDELEIERNAQNPDALAHTLCGDCAETFKFDI
jgi:hypothetical protein